MQNEETRSPLVVLRDTDHELDMGPTTEDGHPVVAVSKHGVTHSVRALCELLGAIVIDESEAPAYGASLS